MFPLVVYLVSTVILSAEVIPLAMKDAKLGGDIVYASQKKWLADWKSTGSATWTFEVVEESQALKLVIEYAIARWKSGTLVIKVDDQLVITKPLRSTNSWNNFEQVIFKKELNLKKGTHTISLAPSVVRGNFFCNFMPGQMTAHTGFG
jgi:hypothetical protein